MKSTTKKNIIQHTTHTVELYRLQFICKICVFLVTQILTFFFFFYFTNLPDEYGKTSIFFVSGLFTQCAFRGNFFFSIMVILKGVFGVNKNKLSQSFQK